ncbi:MAG: fibronectin type III domain-containing protein [bacterium]
MKYFKKTICSAVIASMLIAGVSVRAEFRSDSYVIFENINHYFDGPVITGVTTSSIDSDTVTITWSTDVLANSFVVYSINSDMSDSFEQGTDSKTYTSHSVALVGLSAVEQYYYQVRSERVNGGITTDSTINSFTTAQSSGTLASVGGGVLVITRGEEIPPLVTDVRIAGVGNDAMTISWETDEPSTNFIEYGLTPSYGETYGNWATSTDHTVTVNNLLPASRYYFRALSSDKWGNVGYSNQMTLITLTADGEVVEEPLPIEEAQAIEAESENFFTRFFPEINFTEINLSQIGTLADLENLLPAPAFSTSPTAEIDGNNARIVWTTDVNSNSLVAIAPEDDYSPGAAEPYIEITGNSEEFVQNHEVRLYNLLPNTAYHFQVRSKTRLGQTARSIDAIFTTGSEGLRISNFFSQVQDAETATFKWVTNKEADSAVKITPYRNNVLAVDESRVFRDNAMTAIHEIIVANFEGGTIYEVELSSVDAIGSLASETISMFSTSADDLPPVISYIRADSTVFVDKSNKIQTVISWMTNEPSTSKVYYQEGVRSGIEQFRNSTELNTDYAKEHVMVVSKFKPGKVYSFRVESIDSGGNTTISSAHTLMTAKQQESIVQMILRILEETFGWLKDLINR